MPFPAPTPVESYFTTVLLAKWKADVSVRCVVMQLKPKAVSTVSLAYKMVTHISNYIEFIAWNHLALESKKKIIVELYIHASVKVVRKCLMSVLFYNQYRTIYFSYYTGWCTRHYILKREGRVKRIFRCPL